MPAYVHLPRRPLPERNAPCGGRRTEFVVTPAELPRLDLPVPVVHGTHDTSAPLEATGLRTARPVPDGMMKVCADVGHGLFATHADGLTDDLRAFASGN